MGRARRLLGTTLVAGVVAAALGPPAGAGTALAELRPNLRMRRPASVQLVRGSGTHRTLRFSTITVNRGIGPLELEPRLSMTDCNGNGDAADDRAAYQHVYGDTDANGIFDPNVDTTFTSVQVGCFEWHAKHSHWHFVGFARYALRALHGTRVFAQRAKVGFCSVDNIDTAPTLPGSPADSHYRYCDDLAIQGISVGWADLYDRALAGQSLNVTGVPPGDYCLEQEVDPDDHLLETDETDNARGVPVRIRTGSASALSGSC